MFLCLPESSSHVTLKSFYEGLLNYPHSFLCRGSRSLACGASRSAPKSDFLGCHKTTSIGANGGGFLTMTINPYECGFKAPL